MEQQDLSDLQVLQNHNLLIALGGVAARRTSGASHFSMPVCIYDSKLESRQNRPEISSYDPSIFIERIKPILIIFFHSMHFCII